MQQIRLLPNYSKEAVNAFNSNDTHWKRGKILIQQKQNLLHNLHINHLVCSSLSLVNLTLSPLWPCKILGYFIHDQKKKIKENLQSIWRFISMETNKVITAHTWIFSFICWNVNKSFLSADRWEGEKSSHIYKVLFGGF